MARVVLEFIGMSVLLEQTRGVSVGLLKEPGHLHLVSYTDPETGTTAVDSVRLRGSLELEGTTPAETVLRNIEQLPDLGSLPGTHGVVSQEILIREHLQTLIVLPGGVFEALPPILRGARGPWRFRGDQTSIEKDLTDRAIFTCESTGGTVRLGGITLGQRDGEHRATIMAIDHDSGQPRPQLRPGDPLTEFGLFYRCTSHPGPIPTFTPRGVPADPGNPICPMARARLM